MMAELAVGRGVMALAQGDITKFSADAIVTGSSFAVERVTFVLISTDTLGPFQRELACL